MAIVWLHPLDLEVGGPLHSAKLCRESPWAINHNVVVNNSLWSGGSGSRSNDRPRSVAKDRSGGVARGSRLKRLKSGLGIAPFLVILLPVKDFALLARVAIPVDATTNVVELVEVAPNISTTGLVDFLVDVRVGIA